MKTLIGIVTFGNLEFTKLAVESIRETVKSPVDIFLIVGKPGDAATGEWSRDYPEISGLTHRENCGFPASINDIYQHAWLRRSYDNVIIMGNDVVAYPGAIDAMIHTAETTDYEWICASQFDAKSLVERYPEARPYFHGENLVFSDFTARPWELHRDFRAPEIRPDSIQDVRNLCLFKRSVFEQIGYADANFWPGGYFEDNDYCYRAQLAGLRACTLAHAAYFHFWSRTIHQSGKSEDAHHHQFRRNELFYRAKWGGDFGQEKYLLPFNGMAMELTGWPGFAHRPWVKIPERAQEEAIIAHWASQPASAS